MTTQYKIKEECIDVFKGICHQAKPLKDTSGFASELSEIYQSACFTGGKEGEEGSYICFF